MAEVLTDVQARQEAQKRYRERAEKQFEEIISKTEKFLDLKGERDDLYPPVGENALKNLRVLYEQSDFGAAKFLQVADKLASLAQKIEDQLSQFSEGQIETEWSKREFEEKKKEFGEETASPMHRPKYFQPRNYARGVIEFLRSASEAFLKKAAQPALIR